MRSRDGAGNDLPRPLVSIVSPCFDEAEVIGLFHRELCAVVDAIEGHDFELVYVDDGSADGTLDALNRIAEGDGRVRVCSFSRNFGHQIALTAGLDLAVGDAVVMIDSDLQHPPSLIPAMLAQWRAGVDVVSAVRVDTERASIFKKVASRGFYVVLNLLSTVRVPEGAADFCLLSRRTADTLRGMRERHRFLRGMISWAGYSRSFLPYTAPARAAGRSKYTLVKMLAMAFDAILSFSTAPIGLASRVGVLVVLLGFGYLVWNFVVAFRTGRWAPGWASLIAVVMVLGGTQILFTGLIGQYLARAFEELKGRPLYVLKQAPPKPAARDPRGRVPVEEAERRPSSPPPSA
jgi:glycosyltransferase involved in cell wall biosynthesis